MWRELEAASSFYSTAMYTPAIILVAFSLISLCCAEISYKEYDDLQSQGEDVSLGLVAGIPYGSVSGRVSEYFATLRTPLRRKQIDNNYDTRNSDLNSASVGLQQLDDSK